MLSATKWEETMLDGETINPTTAAPDTPSAVDPAAAPAESAPAVAAPVVEHAEDCGSVGATGEHGDIGENATAEPTAAPEESAPVVAAPAPVVEIAQPTKPTTDPPARDWSWHPQVKEAIDFVMAHGYAPGAAELIVLERGFARILEDKKQDKDPTMTNRPKTEPSLTHADECGAVGATGQHGNIGENAN